MRKSAWKTIVFSLTLFSLLCALAACGGHTHAYGEWQTVKEATCTEAGEQERFCACKARETEIIPASHAYHNSICTRCGLGAEDGYRHAVAENQGVQNVIDRAYLLTDVEWTPVADMPGLKGNGKLITFEAGKTVTVIASGMVGAYDIYVIKGEDGNCWFITADASYVGAIN